MFRPLSLFVGTRYTRAKRRNHYISFISLTSMTWGSRPSTEAHQKPFALMQRSCPAWGTAPR